MIGKDIDEVNRIRKSLNSLLFTDAPEYWFSQISGKINKLKAVDNELSTVLIKNVNIVKSDVYFGLMATLLGSILSLVVALSFGLIISKRITRTLDDFNSGLDSFFDFLNYKIEDVPLLKNNST